MFSAIRLIKCGLPVMFATALAGCQPSYSPDTYASDAVQQANKVEAGIVIGFRQVSISANGTVGTVTGAAAGGVLGASRTDATGIPTALSALGGSVVGGLVGSTIEHTTGDATGWEYIVRQTNGDLISVTQREPTPIAIGQKVLVITGKQARIVADYSTPPEPAPSKADKKETPPAAAVAAPSPPPGVATSPSVEEAPAVAPKSGGDNAATPPAPGASPSDEATAPPT